jgi:serine/threonine protein kinase/Tol biopolymer transport system component
MPLTVGTRLGSFEILGAAGAGGMGEVYRARDIRLGRTVAIKILPSADPDLKARFAREARTIATLTHPHICTLYDVGQQDGTDYLVMEYLEGETLAARLQRGRLKPHEVLQHAIEIVDALDRAHRAGVVHRDLKPANIMLTPDGAKLLDFGVAKLRPAPAALMAGIQTVTESTPLTGWGTSVGTPQYMAPEQLEGKEADTRSDLFALGAVFYEMATGRKAFQGGSPASVIAAIMSSEPPVAELQGLTPRGFDHLVKTCLIKNPEERRQTAHDLLLDLRWIAGNQSDSTTPTPRAGTPRWIWIAGTVVLVLAAAAMTRYLTARETVQPLMRVSILPPDGEPPESFPAISPDGRRLAFPARGPAGRTVLWIRQLESTTSVAISGTEEARSPFWSPDGRFIGFFAQGKVKIVAVDLRAAQPPVQTIADAPDPRGGAWGVDGFIVFARNIEDGLYRVQVSGGAVTPVTTLNRDRRENAHRWPQFLPDGRRLLFFVRSADQEHQGIYVGTPGSNDWKLVLRTPLSALVASRPKRSAFQLLSSEADAYLLFMREQTVLAQPFDLGRLELGGEPTPIAESVGTAMNRGMFSVAGNSTLAYRVQAGDTQRPSWFDRTGKPLGYIASPDGGSARLSPDAGQIAFNRVDPQRGAGDIWLEDVARRTVTRLTSHPGYEWTPVWSPGGDRIAFASNRDATMDLYEKSVRVREPEQPLLKSDKRKIPTDWSRDGGFLLFHQESPPDGWDLWALPMTGERKAFPILRSEFNEFQGSFSPDGKWLAYTSDETGQNQVYVQPFTAASSGASDRRGRWPVSAAGGSQPRWRSDGRELFYLSRDGKMMSVSIKPGPSFQAGGATPLFAATNQISSDPLYDVTPDGKRFLITFRSDEKSELPTTLLLNWTAALKN